MVTELAGNHAWAPKTLPVLRWHARQWQAETRSGSADVIAESCPQEQEAVRTGINGVRADGVADRGYCLTAATPIATAPLATPAVPAAVKVPSSLTV